MKKIAIIGAGGFGREVKMLIDQINHHKKQYQNITKTITNIITNNIIQMRKKLSK